jgi:hypothetical protein
MAGYAAPAALQRVRSIGYLVDGTLVIINRALPTMAWDYTVRAYF